MKKSSFFYFSFAALLAAGFSSCQEEDLGFDEEYIHEKAVLREYQKNFENRYGTIDPNHDWGFYDVSSFSFPTGTRADGDYSGAGFVHVNRNMWTETDNNGYKADALASVVSIPGWPNFDGYFYTVTGSGSYNRISNTQPTDMSADQAAGDVTDYEIRYVSQWFREHRNPNSLQLHLTDFFIQNISGDADRVITKGNRVTENNKEGEMCNGAPVETVCGESSAAAFGMEHLVFKTMNSNNTIDDTWTHMNNYNNGNTNDFWKAGNDENPGKDLVLDADKQGDNSGLNGSYKNTYTHDREIKYVTSSGTEDFAYLSSFGTGSIYYHNWVLVKLEWQEKGADGQMHDREGYYLAFDFETSKDGKTYQRDGFYSNWIVKISPAFAQLESPRNVRVMCEDLGNTLDFDFNDVVFDVRYERTAGYDDNDANARFDAIITLQAAGGTMKINVGINDANYEAHKLLENEVKQPVNVDKGASHEVAIYRINNLTSKNPDDIKIWVNHNTESDAMDRIVVLGQSKNSTPQKFAVPTSVRWTKENKQIEDAYELFGEWVNNKLGYSDTYDQWGNKIPASVTNWYAPTKDEIWKDGKKYTETVHENLLH